MTAVMTSSLALGTTAARIAAANSLLASNSGVSLLMGTRLTIKFSCCANTAK